MKSRRRPSSIEFLGDVNVFHGRVCWRSGPYQGVRTAQHWSGCQDAGEEHEVTFVRPHDMELQPISDE
jgi:hypothetical protein